MKCVDCKHLHESDDCGGGTWTGPGSQSVSCGLGKWYLGGAQTLKADPREAVAKAEACADYEKESGSEEKT